MGLLQAGTQAPGFELKASNGQTIKLSEALKQGKHVVLAFFPAAFTPVCSEELSLFQEFIDEFGRLGAMPVGVSTDNPYSLTAFAEARNLTFPLAGDFHPQGAVATQYGVMADDGMTNRALFIIDPQGLIRYSYLSPRGENPGVDRIFDALEELGGGE